MDINIAGEHINQLSQSIKFNPGNGGAITVLELNMEYKIRGKCATQNYTNLHFNENFLDITLLNTKVINNSHQTPLKTGLLTEINNSDVVPFTISKLNFTLCVTGTRIEMKQ